MEKIELLVKYESDIISGKRFGAVDKCIDYIFNSFIISGSGIKEFKIIKANTRDSILIHKLMKLFHIDNLNVVNNNQDMRFSNVLMEDMAYVEIGK